ncbi:MAG: HD domain-containing protein [Lachnospiraceae bacterium]|nr:HD domain-containing protein [Candidatus Equihabitans merdae]
MILDSVPGKYGRPKVERKSTGKDKSDNQSTPVQVDTRNRLERQMAFALELDKEKLIGRQNYLSDGQRKENDAEHAWHLAIMTLLLSEYANEPIDVLHTVAMVLMHDVVEIDAGDTYAYDENGKASQAEREMKAAKRIYNMLPEDQARKYMDLWLEFEEQKTPEARFARTMDNIQPLILNVAANGRSWLENGIHLSQVLGRNRHTASGSEELWQHAFNNLIKPSVDEGWLKNP